MKIQLLYGYFMRCLLLTRKCPSQNCGKQQVGEELCVKRLADVLCSEEEKGEEEGGSVSSCSCFVSEIAVTQLKQAEHLAAMLGKGSRSQLCPSFFWAGSPWKCYDSHHHWGQKEPAPQPSWIRERELFRRLSLSHLSPKELVSVSGGWNAAVIGHVHTWKTSRFWLLKHSEPSCQK